MTGLVSLDLSRRPKFKMAWPHKVVRKSARRCSRWAVRNYNILESMVFLWYKLYMAFFNAPRATLHTFPGGKMRRVTNVTNSAIPPVRAERRWNKTHPRHRLHEPQNAWKLCRYSRLETLLIYMNDDLCHVACSILIFATVFFKFCQAINLAHFKPHWVERCWK